MVAHGKSGRIRRARESGIYCKTDGPATENVEADEGVRDETGISRILWNGS